MAAISTLGDTLTSPLKIKIICMKKINNFNINYHVIYAANVYGMAIKIVYTV